MSGRWAGYEAAMARDPNGVYQVLRLARMIPHSEERETMSPSLELELAWIIERESRWRQDIQNSIGATGLIQFMPSTAKSLGTTTNELREMTLSQQAPYVLKYFENVFGTRRMAERPGDLYMMTFYPEFFGQGADFVIADEVTRPKVWEQNPGLRCSPQGPITCGCVRAFGIPTSLPATALPVRESIGQPEGPTVSKGVGGGAPFGVILFILALLAIRAKR